MGNTMKMARLGVVAGAGMLAMSGAALAAGPTCEDGPIQLGAVATETGPVDFSAGPKTTAAYFDKLNAEGGINGCSNLRWMSSAG